MADHPARPFVVLTLTRSGSTWLLTLLNGQDGIAAYEELFLPGEVRPEYAWVAAGSPDRFHIRERGLPGLRIRRVWNYLREVERSGAACRAVGFKLMLGQLSRVPEVLLLLALRRYRLLVLVRDNLFEGAVSRLVLEKTGDAQSRADAPADRRMVLDPDALIAQMKRRRRGVRILKVLAAVWPAPSLVLRYEDLVRDQRRGIEDVLSLLGIESEPKIVVSPMKRRISKPYTDIIANFDDVREAIENSSLRHTLTSAHSEPAQD